ncbi:hypothetical protein [Flavisolibacter nicotianae]|uniref:hypothetical protein n=1 Tax=Flavisolibacter nicotianae TaxID=2364882 RepID=UPI0013C4AC3B|nr:hypothetical protein [Flavisolibacter nicotianae]
MKIATLVVSLFLGATCFAQPSKKKLSVGIEQDDLPYLTGVILPVPGPGKTIGVAVY